MRNETMDGAPIDALDEIPGLKIETWGTQTIRC
jgi:hypothetical protein